MCRKTAIQRGVIWRGRHRTDIVRPFLFFSFYVFFFGCEILFWLTVVVLFCHWLVLHNSWNRLAENSTLINPFTASCENAMTLSVPGIPASCEKFPHSSQLYFWSTESIFNQFSVFLRTLNALCVCLQYKYHRSIKRVIRSDKPVTLLLLLWSHKCDFGAEPRSRIIATSAVKGLIFFLLCKSWFATVHV
jgi:hypothetical protein